MELNDIISNYSEAFFSVVEDKKRGLDFLKSLREGLKKSNEFKLVLNQPYIEVEKKFEITEEILGKQLNKYEKNFLKILFDNHRINVLDKIFEKYNQIFIELSEVQPVEILTPKKIPEKLLKELKETLGEKLDKKIAPQVIVDKGLVGGIKLKINGEVYDNTIKTMLDNFQEKIAQKGV